MEITQQKSGDILVIRLAGRLDASWSDSVEEALTAAVRAGEHGIRLDMEQVDYISSAGLRVIFSLNKQLLSIKGSFGILNPSPAVRSVVEMVGIGSLITQCQTNDSTTTEEGRGFTSEQAEYEIFDSEEKGMFLSVHGEKALLQNGISGDAPFLSRFDSTTFALGIGALGNTLSDCESRFGEFLAVGGFAAFQPTDDSTRPDFAVSEGSYTPEGYLLLGLRGEGGFPHLVRFKANEQSRTVGLSELAATALQIAKTPEALVVGVAETAGLVGATLRKSPAEDSDSKRFDFPRIRDWLSFTSDRSCRDGTALIVGVVAQGDTPYRDCLRPLSNGYSGHFHAAAFLYKPLQKGRISMDATVAALFEGHNIQSILHLICDSREIIGLGESEFYRGALWIAPILPAKGATVS